LREGHTDRVKHKLAKAMEKAGESDLERRFIVNLYWMHRAAVRWDGEISKDVVVEMWIRQGCVISSLLFNLYSKYKIKEALGGGGVAFIGKKYFRIEIR